MGNRFSKICKRIAAFVAAIIVGLPSTASLVPVSAADKLVNEYDSTNVITDLGEVVVDSLALEAASANKGADPKLYTVAEYCYSGNKTITDARYGLYIYVYNPGAIAIETGVTANTVNMAVSYGEDGQPNAYENMPMKYCGTTGGKYTNLIYKFRVLDSDKVLAAANMSLSDGGERRYDIASIDLLHIGEHLQKSYAISKTFYYSGFAKGCGAGAEATSTLTCRYEDLDTVEIEVNHAVYRDLDIRMQVNTAYFGIEDGFLEKYGELQKIKAEWWEYLTNLMFVTSDPDGYAALKEQIGENIGVGTGADGDWRFLWDEIEGSTVETGNSFKDWWYNLRKEENVKFNSGYNVPKNFFETTNFEESDGSGITQYDFSMTSSWNQYGQIDWLFKTDEINSSDDYDISRDTVIDYMEDYTGWKDGQPIGDLTNKYSAALFEDYLPSYRRKYLVDQTSQNGHCMWEFDIANQEDWNWTWYDFEPILEKWETEINPITGERRYSDTFIAWMREYYESRYTTDNLAPFVVLDGTGDTKGWQQLSYEKFGEKYLISEKDAKTVHDACVAMDKAGETPVLFRFAVTDYYTSKARLDQIGDGNMSQRDSYVAQQSMFLNFRVISFTFHRDGVETVLGVASDPIDIINGLDAPSGLYVPGKEIDWLYVLKMVLSILGLGLLAFVVIWFFLWLRKQWNGGNY